MADAKKQATPHPPGTPEFGHVVVGGPAHRYPAQDGIQVVKLAVGPYDNDVYLIASDGEAVIVDGAAEPERILGELQALGATARLIVQTHNHPDHTEALPSLVAQLRVPVLAHPADPMPVATEDLLGGETLEAGSARIEVLATPGHTSGSLCFRVGAHLFTGDTLFPGGPGNTVGDPSQFREIMRSLDGLFSLPDETRVSPGHGLDTTIGRERPFVEVWRARGW
jgi:glyoxylase-like metal-dependent hydrolase (beta-lactamase superfamily II)